MRLFTVAIFMIMIIFFSDVAHSLELTCPNPRESASAIRAARKCLPQLQTNPQLFTPCRTKICYLFLQEAPFIILPPDFHTIPTNPSLLQPFPCGRPQQLHPALTGLAFSLHNQTSSADELCIWAGRANQCTFNALVDLIDLAADQGYNFAVSGLLLNMPDRECRLSPSSPILEDEMIVIGRRTDGSDSVSPSDAWQQLTGPFDAIVWLLFISVFLLQLLMCYFIARRFPGFAARPRTTTFKLFIGDLSGPTTNDEKSDTGYVVAARLSRSSFLLFLAIFIMLYELAAVNFLFQQLQMEIGKSVRSLSTQELGEYAVLRNSALEKVWNASVNPTGTKYDSSRDIDIPWQRCTAASNCVEWLSNEEENSRFTVTFRIAGQYLMKSERQCDKLTVLSTEDILYQFSANWLYNRNVDSKKRKTIDTELAGLRITGTTRELIEEHIGKEEGCTGGNEIQITLFIALFPIAIFVMGPLLCTVCSLMVPDDHDDHECGGLDV